MFDVTKSIKTVSELQSAMEQKTDTHFVQGWIKTLTKDVKIADISAQKGVVWFPLDDLADRCGDFRAVLDVVTYERYSSRGERFRSVSALSLLATISTLLANDEDHSLHELALTSIIPAFLPNTENAMAGQPEVEDVLSNGDDKGEVEVDPLEAEEQSDFPAFIERMKAWKRFALQYSSGTEQPTRKTAEVSAAELARMAERMHDQLLSLDEEVTPKWKTGHILHRQITNVLHALLVTTSGSSGRLASPKSSDRPLVEALRRAADNEAQAFHPLAAIVLACPLVWAFLNPMEAYKASGTITDKLRDEVEEALQIFQAKYGSQETCFDPEWLSPPKIAIVVGRLHVANPRTVKQEGFFDLLNVVPRYYPKSGAAK